MKGRAIVGSEVEKLRQFFGNKIPLTLLTFLTTNPVVGTTIKLSEAEDQSGYGAVMQWMTPDEQIEEAAEFYPGQIVIQDSYIPVAKCLKGSGDPYFVKEANSLLQLYRIPHTCIRDNGYEKELVEYVCLLSTLVSKL